MIVDEAQRYAAHGLAVFPLQPQGKDPLDGSRGFKDATTDAAKIAQWWGIEPTMNVGMATGAKSGGVFVVDVDMHDGVDGGMELAAWEAENGKLPETASSVTGSGGTHYFYRAPAGVSVRSAAHVIDGVDVRGDGGYVVMPPSVHPNGNRYEWDMEPWEDCEIAEADEVVLRLVRMNNAQEQQHFELPDVIKHGVRDDTIFKYACSLQAQGLSDELIYRIVSDTNKARCQPPLTDAQVRKKVEQATKYDKGPSDGIDAASPGEGVSLATNSKGNPLQTSDNALRVLMHDERLAGHFWYNTMAYQRMVTLPLPWDSGEGERAVVTEDYIGLTVYMERVYGLTSTQKITDAVLYVCRQNPRNPVTEYLDSLEWDGQPRLGAGVTFLGAENNRYNNEVERLFFLGAVARAYEPGIKFDYVPILVGEQGIGKSQYARMICQHDEWYSDNFNTIDGDQAAEKMRGIWVAELAELLATKRAREVEAIKAFVTSTKDIIRPKYERETVQRPRVCVFIGTTNDYQFLTDSTGNRRFLPVECKAKQRDPRLWSDFGRDWFTQALAEAVHVWKDERPALVLPDDLADTARQMQEQHAEDDPLVGIVQEWADARLAFIVNNYTPGSIHERVCVREVYDALKEKYPDLTHNDNRYVYKNLTNAMNKCGGWVRLHTKQRTADYGLQRVWVPDRPIVEN